MVDGDGARSQPEPTKDGEAVAVTETPKKRPRLHLDSPSRIQAAPAVEAPSNPQTDEIKKLAVGESQPGNERFLSMMKAKASAAGADAKKAAAAKK